MPFGTRMTHSPPRRGRVIIGAMPPFSDSDVTRFARTTFRLEGRLFGIRRGDRRAHMYVIGKTGTGKSTLLKTLIGQDVMNGEGLAVFDPHGDLVEEVRASLPERRSADLLYLNLPDPALRLRFNPLAGIPPERQPLAAANLIDIFSKIWADAWGPRLEHILRNACLTLLEQPHATLADIPRLFEDAAFRKQTVSRLRNKRVEAFWTKEYDRYPPYVRSQAIAPVQNKVGAFLADPRIFRVLATPGDLLVPRAAIDGGKIPLVNLSKGEMGEGPAALMGALLVGSLGLAGLVPHHSWNDG
jgi:energy-coupling factor transporter ATP-binding protein EcfA2